MPDSETSRAKGSVGYARISKADGSQRLDLQRDALKEAGVDLEHCLYEDECSGSVPSGKRPGLAAALKAIRPGDTLVIWRLDRLGRSLHDLITTVRDLEAWGISLQVLTGFPIDTTIPAGKMVFGIFASLAEYERDLIKERIEVGLKAARARGRVGGRPMVMTRSKVLWAQAAMRDRKTVVSELCKELGVSTQTLYRFVGPDGELQPAGEKLVNGKKG